MISPIYQPITPVVEDRPPTSVLEWLRLFDYKISVSPEKTIRGSILTATDETARKSMFHAPLAFFGMAVRNCTHLWNPGTADLLADELRQIHLRYPLMGFPENEQSFPIDSRLNHPDNVSWVLFCLYADWIQGKYSE